MLKSHLMQRTTVSYNQLCFFGIFFSGGPAHLLGFCSLLVAVKTQPGSVSQAALSYLLLQRRERRLRAGLKWLFSSRSLRKNKIWFAIPCSTCAGSSALRARETAFCPLSVCDEETGKPRGIGGFWDNYYYLGPKLMFGFLFVFYF